MKNLYMDRLESFSFSEVLDALNGVGAESERLEFKREIQARKLAHEVCAFANASGGIIAIGIEEPDRGSELRLAQVPPNIGDRMLLSYNSCINALVYPQPPFEMFGYSDDASRRAILVVRVGSSTNGPHEYIGKDGTNLPVRRGTETTSLGLADIEALQRRRDGTFAESPLLNRAFRRVSLTQRTPDDFYFGVHVQPVTYARRRVMDIDDDLTCREVEELTRGMDCIVHHPMNRNETTRDGFWMYSGDSPAEPHLSGTQLEIDSDGEILIRFAQRQDDAVEQYINIFLTAYAAAQDVFYRFGIAPSARFHVVARLDDFAHIQYAAQFHEDYFVADLARQSFADAFTETMLLMLRADNQSPERRESHKTLAEHASRKLPILDGLLVRWLTPLDEPGAQ